MGLKIFLLLTAFLASISLGTAIKCYVCAGSQNSDCAKGDESAMSVIKCKTPGPGLTHKTYTYFNPSGSDSDDPPKFQPVCLKLVETEYQPNLFARGCGLFPADIDPCRFLEDNAQVTGCKSCKTDLCNANMGVPIKYSFGENLIDD